MEKVEEQNGHLHNRLSELVKSHTKSEESLQDRDRQISQLKSELDAMKSFTRNLQDKVTNLIKLFNKTWS